LFQYTCRENGWSCKKIMLFFRDYGIHCDLKLGEKKKGQK